VLCATPLVDGLASSSITDGYLFESKQNLIYSCRISKRGFPRSLLTRAKSSEAVSASLLSHQPLENLSSSRVPGEMI
jgi:hypothetical protein